MKHNIQILIVTFFLVTINSVCSQEGPELPCPDCTQSFVKPIPYEGSWYNPEQSGSGFLIDVQNDRLLGFYFGYDEQGGTDWALFSGQLQDASDQNALWKVNATLEKFSGGSCLNCEYSAPEQNQTLGEIEIIFNRMAHASFSVNGGQSQNIVPLYFGYSLIDHSAQEPAYLTPELEGWWTIFINANNDDGVTPDQYTYTNYMVYVSKGVVAGDGSLNFITNFFPNVPEVFNVGTIKCVREENQMQFQTKCNYDPDVNITGFEIDLANISPNRLYGEAPNGDTIEMIRTNSDHCISSNQPENCVNTGVFDYLND